MARPKRDLRLLPAAACAWLGAAATILTGRPLLVVATACALGAVGLAVLAAPGPAGKGRRRRWLERLLPYVLLGGALLCAVSLSAAAHLHVRATHPLASAISNGQQVELSVTLLKPPRHARIGVRWQESYVLHVDGAASESGMRPVPPGLRVVALGAGSEAQRGDKLLVVGRLAPLPGTSDQAALLLDARVVAREKASGPVEVMRARFAELAGKLTAVGQGLVPGVALGDDSAMSETLTAAMRRVNLGHLTAISGTHIGLVIGAGALLLARAGRRTRVAVLGCTLAGLVALVGPEPSVLRAAGMGSFAFLALARGRIPVGLPSIFGAICVCLIVDPWLALSFGFALSVSAASCIMVLLRPFQTALGPGEPRHDSRFPRLRWLWKVAATAAAVAVAAGLGCGPILVLFSPEVSYHGVLANLLAAPAVPFATLFGLLAVVLAVPAPWLAGAALQVAEGAAHWIAGTALAVAHLPGAAHPWQGGPIGALQLAFLNSFIALGLFGLARARLQPDKWAGRAENLTRALFLGSGRSRARAAAVAASLLAGSLAVVAFVGVLFAPPARTWDVWQCDVGEGSALLIRTGPHSAAMVDVGTRLGRSQDCLAAARIRHLDLLILTHPHADHVENLPAVLAAVPVERIVISPAAEPARNVAFVAREAAAAGRELAVSTISPGTGAHQEHGPPLGPRQIGWEVVWPLEGSGEANDLSVVVLFTLPHGRVLSLGDLGAGAQEALVGELERRGIANLDVVQVAHHGSRDQSTQLAELLRPGVALISVGENSYGHPHRDALALYGKVSGAVVRSDEHGHLWIDLAGQVRIGRG